MEAVTKESVQYCGSRRLIVIKVGDKVRSGKLCGIEDLVIFWDYKGTVEKIWDVPAHEAFFMFDTCIQPYSPAHTRVQVRRSQEDGGDWFVSNIEDLVPWE